MLIRRDQFIVDRPAVEVREMMRVLRRDPHSALAFARHFELEPSEAHGLLDAFVSEGLIEQAERGGRVFFVDGEAATSAGVVLWSTTIAGTALAKARIGTPMPRRKAQELLDGVVERAVGINGSEAWLHWVSEVVLYGSFASEGEGPVGDIDVAVRLQQRFEDDEYDRRQRAMIETDDAYPANALAYFAYAQQKVVRHLRGRSPKVDLVEFDDRQPLPPGATSRVVYRRST